MFSRSKSETPKPYSAPLPESAPVERRRSVLHEGIRIKGDWTSDGVVEFGGTIEGDLTAEVLVLTAQGKIKGNVRAHTVTIEGHLEGTIAAIKVILKHGARVKADIAAEAIAVESGAEIEGRLSVQPKSA
jgi:cytoskeletal protein CcmA (bactofilin family)